jgi:glycerophosphoryl diester phosphodiesterase
MRTPFRTPVAVAAVFTVAIALLTACGGGTDPGNPADAATDTTAATGATTNPAPTIDELLATDGVLNIAHAGGDVVHPHSTLFGYAESVAAGADVLEMDVQLSADGVVVVIHDLTVDGTTNGTGEVAGFTVDELQALDAAWWFCPGCGDDPDPGDYPWRGVATGDTPPPAGYGPADFRIPTLAEVATAFPNLPLDIEIKGTTETGALNTARALADELEALGRLDSVVVVSFDSAVVQAFHDLAPSVEVSPGLGELVDWYFSGGELATHYRIIQIPPDFEGIEVLDANAMDAASEAGLVVWVWPSSRDQENVATYRSWIDLGVGGVIAGDPAAMTAALGTAG